MDSLNAGGAEVMEKAEFTLERLLDEVLFKEHLQDLLKENGEISSGQKPELIERFLNSEMVHRKTVDTIVREILGELSLSDLRDFGHSLNIELPSTKQGMVRRLMKDVTFEPYVREVERDCPVCRAKTIHDLHFKTDWQASYFRCTTCNTATTVGTDGPARDFPPKNEPQSDEASGKNQALSSELEFTLKMVDNIAPTVRRLEKQKKNNLDNIAPTIRLLEQQKKLDLETLKAVEMVMNPPKIVTPAERLVILEATRIKEEREAREKAERQQKRNHLWTIDALILTLGFGVPSLGGAFDNGHAFLYLVVGLSLLCAFAGLTFFLVFTRNAGEKEKKKGV